MLAVMEQVNKYVVFNIIWVPQQATNALLKQNTKPIFSLKFLKSNFSIDSIIHHCFHHTTAAPSAALFKPQRAKQRRHAASAARGPCAMGARVSTPTEEEATRLRDQLQEGKSGRIGGLGDFCIVVLFNEIHKEVHKKTWGKFHSPKLNNQTFHNLFTLLGAFIKEFKDLFLSFVLNKKPFSEQKNLAVKPQEACSAASRVISEADVLVFRDLDWELLNGAFC